MHKRDNMNYFFNIIVLILIFSPQSRGFENDQHLSLVCPEGLMAKGFTWYAQTINTISNEDKSQNFSICVNCKPENNETYQWIEICFSNNDNILGVNFINIFCSQFLYERLFLVMFKLEKVFCTKNARKKRW